MTALGTYLADASRRPMEWGKHDCCTFPAEWFGPIVGRDLLDGWRGTYVDEATARARIAECGGLDAVWQQQLEGAAVVIREDDLEPGDIGLLLMGEELIGGIWSGDRWMVLGARGLAGIARGRLDEFQVWGPR